MATQPITTTRLTLQPFTAAMLDALIAGDATRLFTITGARFSEPVQAPPLMDDVLALFRDQLRERPQETGWWGWLIVERESHEAVGGLGVSAPDANGVSMLGYAVYPTHERRGYASEAAAALLDWALAQPEVQAVDATIPPWNASSLRVAAKLGMVQSGTAHDDEVGEVLVFRRERGGSAHAPGTGGTSDP